MAVGVFACNHSRLFRKIYFKPGLISLYKVLALEMWDKNLRCQSSLLYNKARYEATSLLWLLHIWVQHTCWHVKQGYSVECNAYPMLDHTLRRDNHQGIYTYGYIRSMSHSHQRRCGWKRRPWHQSTHRRYPRPCWTSDSRTQLNLQRTSVTNNAVSV